MSEALGCIHSTWRAVILRAQTSMQVASSSALILLSDLLWVSVWGFHLKRQKLSQTWWHTPAIPTRWTLRQEAIKFEVNPGYIRIPCLNKTTTKN